VLDPGALAGLGYGDPHSSGRGEVSKEPRAVTAPSRSAPAAHPDRRDPLPPDLRDALALIK